MSFDLSKKIQDIPPKPGVYIFRNRKNEPIYVGKAVSLRSRVRSYFADPGTLAVKTQAMMEHAIDVEYIVTDTELEALILESNLIKQHRPRYNVRIKDDKRYPWLKFTYGEDFPRLYIVRLPRRDKHKYFGPFPRTFALRQTLKLIHTLFRIRTCKLEIEQDKKAIDRPCLEYDLKRCDAPCVCFINHQEYRKICDQVCLFLEGRMDEILKQLTGKMNLLSEQMKFEEAAAVRDQISHVKEVQTRQTIYTADAAERDILGAKWYGDTAVMAVFVTRNGKLIGKEKFRLDGTEGSTYSELLSNFIKQHYTQAVLIPKELYLPEHPEDEIQLQEWLSQLKGRKVEIIVPERGEKHRLVEMVEQNAELHLQQELIKKNPLLGKMPQGLFDLQKVLKLEKLPLRIEAFDISNISGTDAVGSMVVLKNGIPAKSEYRKFKIKTVEGIDDFAMMHEIVSRRMKYIYRESSIEEGANQEYYKDSHGMDEKPDIVLIDGGAGQLNAALSAIRELGGGKKIPFTIIGLAKKLEEIYFPGLKEPLLLPYESKALQLLQVIRDEAHRFAITYHRTLRGKKIAVSILDELEGIGEKRKMLLLQKFGSVNELKQASLEDLENIPGLGKKLAGEVFDFLKTQG